VVFIDESGLLPAPLVRRTQAPRGHPPVLKYTGKGRTRVSVVGALVVPTAHASWQLHHRTYPNQSINNERSAEFLKELLDRMDRPIIVIWDRGSMHRGQALSNLQAEYPRLSMEPLPPYAPDLNPVEKVWSYEKYGRRANFAPVNITQLNEVVNTDLTQIEQQPELLGKFFEGTHLPPPDI